MVANERDPGWGKFKRDMEGEFVPAVRAVEVAAGKAGIATPSPAWVCKHEREHLRATEGLDVD